MRLFFHSPSSQLQYYTDCSQFVSLCPAEQSCEFVKFEHCQIKTEPTEATKAGGGGRERLERGGGALSKLYCHVVSAVQPEARRLGVLSYRPKTWSRECTGLLRSFQSEQSAGAGLLPATEPCRSFPEALDPTPERLGESQKPPVKADVEDECSEPHLQFRHCMVYALNTRLRADANSMCFPCL